MEKIFDIVRGNFEQSVELFWYKNVIHVTTNQAKR